QRNVLTVRSMVVLVSVLLGDAVGLGVLRSYTVRLWRDDGVLVRRGTRLTVTLWLVGVAIHATIDQTVLAGTSSLLLYLGVTWMAQRRVLLTRASRAHLVE
ncbi:MAG TPA: hypothetical protein VFN57_04730, partial [Thermomicrobiaceae bacterium]|nr:hypothetical protein [Thermomicrobiaceae bacterium]